MKDDSINQETIESPIQKKSRKSEDKILESIQFTSKELKGLVDQKAIPTTLSEDGLKQLENTLEMMSKANTLGWSEQQLIEWCNLNQENAAQNIAFMELLFAHKEKLKGIIEPQKKKAKYRQSGHLVDQKLKYNTPKKQPSLFDCLMPETKQIIEESKFEITAEGIKLSYLENKLINAFSALLHEKSQRNNSESDSFYSGNGTFEMISYGMPNKKAIAPCLKFRPSELYKAFMGSENYSGSDIKYIISTLRQLESKCFLINYDRVKTVLEGNKRKKLTDRIEDFQPLFKIVSFIPDLTEEEKASDESKSIARETRGEIIILLNPIFKDQIDTKFIDFPADTATRLAIAARGHYNVTESMNRLMEYMLREISGKRYSPEINEETLPYALGLEKYVKQKRKKLLRERIEKDIQAIINMGIILKAEKMPNAYGTEKWVFHLNKDYD